MDSNNPQPRRSEEMTISTQPSHTASVSRAALEYLQDGDEKPLQGLEIFRAGLGIQCSGKCCTMTQKCMINEKKKSLALVQLQHLTESNHCIGGG